MIHADPRPNPEARVHALQEDYKHVIEHLPTTHVLWPDMLSVFRPDETASTFRTMEEQGPVIISGYHGAGKSSLLRLLEGHAKRIGRPSLSIDSFNLTRPKVDMLTSLLDHGHHRRFEGQSIEDIARSLAELKAVLLVDELTHVFGDAASEGRYAPLISLIDQAAKLGVPTALVIHYLPDRLRRAYELLPSLNQQRLMIPRYATMDETASVMLHGAVYTYGEQPKKPQVLEVENGAVEQMRYYAGAKPAILSQFIQDFYTEQLDVSNPQGQITTAAVDNFWSRNVKETLRWSILDRVLRLGESYFKDDSERILFQQAFNLPTMWEYKKTPEHIRIVDSKDLLPEVRDRWIKMGLVREEAGKIMIDGLLTAMAISYKFLD